MYISENSNWWQSFWRNCVLIFRLSDCCQRMAFQYNSKRKKLSTCIVTPSSNVYFMHFLLFRSSEYGRESINTSFISTLELWEERRIYIHKSVSGGESSKLSVDYPIPSLYTPTQLVPLTMNIFILIKTNDCSRGCIHFGIACRLPFPLTQNFSYKFTEKYINNWANSRLGFFEPRTDLHEPFLKCSVPLSKFSLVPPFNFWHFSSRNLLNSHLQKSEVHYLFCTMMKHLTHLNAISTKQYGLKNKMVLSCFHHRKMQSISHGV